MKLSLLKTLSLGLAAGAVALCSPVQAQTAPMDSTTMAPPMTTMAPANSMMPMPVSGTVLRYYVNRAGFVTAMDVQAADGVKMVRFAPSMAQNLTSMYPVGSTASVYVTSSMMGKMTNYDLAGMGTDMPAPGAMMMPMMVSDVDLLKAEPFTTIGAMPMRVKGKLTGFVSDPMSGEVLAIVIDETTLVRVPRESRLIGGTGNAAMTTPLARGAAVVAYGLPEAPRFGSVSPYTTRLIGTGMAVNGRKVGSLGFGTMKMGKGSTLLGFNLFGGAMSPEETSAMGMGYSTYMAPGTMPGSMDATGTASPAPAPSM